MKWWQLGGGIVLLVVLAAGLAELTTPATCRDFTEASLLIDGAPWQVAVAESGAEQARGLMGCEHLPHQAGMYFKYPEPKAATFWMRGMAIPLDIIWIRDGRVIGITATVPPADPTDVSPPTYQSPGPITAVLEITAGHAAAHGIEVGTPVDFRQ